MTHEEKLRMLRDLPDETVSPAMVSQVLGGAPYTYNLMARKGRLTLPHMWRGRNLRIFKEPLIKLLQGGV